MKKKYTKRRNYATGGAVKNYIANPAQVLAENKQDIAQATYESMSNPLLNIMDMLGKTGMAVGAKMGGMDQLSSLIGIGGDENSFALGGTVNGTNDDDEVLITTKKGNKLTKSQWKDIQTAPNKLWATSSPEDYMSWIDGWAKPFEKDVAEVAGKAFQATPKAKANAYTTTQGVSRSLNGSYNTYPITPAQNRAADSTQFVNQYRLDNKIVTTEQNAANQMRKLKEMGVFAMGGEVISQVPVEVEGNEVAQTPDGQMLQFNGPSHENGGIKTSLPENTIVYSDRISVDGKTMQQRKKSRESKLKKLSSYLDSNPSDAASKNTFERTKEFLDAEEQKDLQIQEIASQQYAPKLATGTGPTGIPGMNVAPYQSQSFDDILGSILGLGTQAEPMTLPVNVPAMQNNTGYEFIVPKAVMTQNVPVMQPKGEGFDLSSMGFSVGDLIGMGSNIAGAFSQSANTAKSRATDTPNINAFENFGQDALDTIDQSTSYINQMKADALLDATQNRNTSKKANRASGRGINVTRALDIAADENFDGAEANINNSFVQQMLQILGQKAGLENTQDQFVMQGEQQRDMADRADKDAYYTNRGADIANMSASGQKIAKDLNSNQYNQDILDMLPDLSQYGIGYTRTKGKLKQTAKK